MQSTRSQLWSDAVRDAPDNYQVVTIIQRRLVGKKVKMPREVIVGRKILDAAGEVLYEDTNGQDPGNIAA